MAVLPLNRVVESLRRGVRHAEASLSDSQLLSQFIEERDEAAFAGIVERHGPMVWGVCRRILAHHQDAEDAFQATFLVLARKAASVRPRGLLGNWLFGVARRTGFKAKTMADKRRRREMQAATLPEPEAAEVAGRDDVELLIDRELTCLPEKYRIAILLCDLEGLTGKAAARRLNVPEGTLATRLRTARAMLAKRLAQQGVALSGAGLALALSQRAEAGVPAALVSATVKAAHLLAAGRAVGVGVVSAQAALLTERMLKAMLLTKLKAPLALLLVVGTLLFAGGVFTRKAAAEGERPPSREAAPPRAKDAEATKKEPTKKEAAVTLTYAVADLVVPIQGLDVGAAEAKKATKEDWLINKLTRTVSPASWERGGGTGTIQYFPLSMSLVVKNTRQVQTQVREVLETMRRIQDVQVVAEARLLTVNAACFRKLQGLAPGLKEKEHAVLSEVETLALLRKAEEGKDAEVASLPKMTLFPGQRAGLILEGVESVAGSGKVELGFSAMVAVNLQHIDLDVKVRAGKLEFKKALRLIDGTTLALCNRMGEEYQVLLVTPHVMLNVDSGEEGVVPAPKGEGPGGDR